MRGLPPLAKPSSTVPKRSPRTTRWGESYLFFKVFASLSYLALMLVSMYKISIMHFKSLKFVKTELRNGLFNRDYSTSNSARSKRPPSASRYPYLQIWRITLKVKLINLLDYWAYNVNLYELGLSNMSSFFGLILQEGELELTLQLHRISHL